MSLLQSLHNKKETFLYGMSLFLLFLLKYLRFSVTFVCEHKKRWYLCIG